MKFAIPEISWHNRDPVLSVDFQPKIGNNDHLRLATGGTDSHVLIWYLSVTESGSVNIEVAADLTRHQKAVNVVRWSPNGQFLASGDDESIIFIWQQKTDKEPIQAVEQGEEQYKESWIIYKTLRGHMEDVLDLSWSLDSLHLASGSVDNKLLVWDVSRGRYSSIITDHKGFVQGVAWDPRGDLIASTSTDRVFRTFDVSTKKVTSRSSKATLPFPSEHPLHNVKVRLYHDDTLQTYYRRLHFSPDGMLIAVPAGKIEPEQGKLDVKPINAVYIYTRYSLKVLTDLTWSSDGLMLVASSTDGYCSVITFADGELGEVLPDEVVTQTDNAATMEVEEQEPQKDETTKEKATEQTKPANNIQTIENFIKFKAPTQKSPKKQKVETNQQKTPVKIDVMEEVAMPSWSDNSNNEIIKLKDTEKMEVDAPSEKPSNIIEIEDSEDMKLVYDETDTKSADSQSPKEKTSLVSPEKKKISPEQNTPKSNKAENSEFLQQAKVTDIKQPVANAAAPSPKAPRRVSFVTLSSPKNAKKK